MRAAGEAPEPSDPIGQPRTYRHHQNADDVRRPVRDNVRHQPKPGPDGTRKNPDSGAERNPGPKYSDSTPTVDSQRRAGAGVRAVLREVAAQPQRTAQGAANCGFPSSSSARPLEDWFESTLDAACGRQPTAIRFPCHISGSANAREAAHNGRGSKSRRTLQARCMQRRESVLGQKLLRSSARWDEDPPTRSRQLTASLWRDCLCQAVLRHPHTERNTEIPHQPNTGTHSIRPHNT